MPNYNRVMVMGNLTKDPIRTGTGNKVTFFTVATNRSWTNDNGEKKEQVTYIDCKAFGKHGKNINDNFFKGRPIFVEGRLVQSPLHERYLKGEYEGKIQTLKVHVERWEFIDKKPKNGQTVVTDVVVDDDVSEPMNTEELDSIMAK